MLSRVLRLVLVAGLCACEVSLEDHFFDSTEDEDVDWTAEYSTVDTTSSRLQPTADVSDDWRSGVPEILTEGDECDEIGADEHNKQNLSEQRRSQLGCGATEGMNNDGVDAKMSAEVTKLANWYELAADPSRWLEFVISLARSWYFLAAVLSYCWHRGHIEIAFLSLVNGLLSLFVWILGLDGRDPNMDNIRKVGRKREEKRLQRKKGKLGGNKARPAAAASRATKAP
jgi:hypothetical protein